MTIKTLLYIVIGYGLIVLAAYLLQRQLVYFPETTRLNENQLSETGLRFWPAPQQFKGIVSTKNQKEAKATVIVFHGNAGAARHRDYYVHALEPLGYRVILAEYPGYGGRQGTMSETHFVTDAAEIIALARSEYGNPIYLLGESMGCAVASAAAADPANAITGLVLVTPWDSLSRVAQTHYWYLPARWLVKDRFDNIENLKTFKGPVAVAMAAHDNVIPNKHTHRLFEAIASAKKRWIFEHAGHNSWPTAPGESWWKEAMDFVSSEGRSLEPDDK